MTTGTGSAVLIQDMGAETQDSGYKLIFRYLVSVLACSEYNNLDWHAQQFATHGFAYYAQKLESGLTQSAIKIFEPATSKMTDAKRRMVMTEILDQEVGSPWSAELNALIDKEHTQSLLFYLVLSLKVRLYHTEASSLNRCMILYYNSWLILSILTLHILTSVGFRNGSFVRIYIPHKTTRLSLCSG